MSIKLKIYDFLVNRHSGIRDRYHKLHDNADTKGKLMSYANLAGMNLQYYLFGKKEFAIPAEANMYEEKLPPYQCSESMNVKNEIYSASRFIKKLMPYDVISFDVFDTLILRPFSEPTDVFYFLSSLGISDLKRIRVEQELLSRREAFSRKKNYEVNLEDIWNRMEKETGIPAKKGMSLECELEKKFCFAAPALKKAVSELAKKGKQLIAVSDMYLSSDFIRELLDKNGLSQISKIYVSNEYGKSKADGSLYDIIKKDYSGKRIIHVGDNEQSDIKSAKEHGLSVLHVPNANRYSKEYRAYDMSPIIGGAWRGVVNNRIYASGRLYTPEYEYGYIYGGLFVLGYCHFIHKYSIENCIDRLFFLARDGDILKKVYDSLFPNEDTCYTFWSRTAAVKAMASANRYDFFSRFITHKVNKGIRIKDILKSMELDALCSKLDSDRKFPIDSDTLLTDANKVILKNFLIEKFGKIKKLYKDSDDAVRIYYEKRFKGAERIAVIDIGWAGSGALALKYLSENVWKLPVHVTGLLAGTNTIHNPQPEASEAFLLSGVLESYMFSQRHNRDVMKKHDLHNYYNVFWEILLTSTDRQFTGFSLSDEKDENGEYKVRLKFGKADENPEGIRQIHKGIMKFIEDYNKSFKDFPYMYNISGRDAYAPILAVTGEHEKYLKSMANRFGLNIGVE